MAENIGKEVSWIELRAGHTYYTRMTGFNPGPYSDYIKIVVGSIYALPHGEAMIYADQGRGFAVGGIFEGELGPKNRFWGMPHLPSKAATAA